ncbi:rhomboid family intramembrane serine protease [Acetivibrio clariflavus]|uniref:Putative membrane protein n=1 Tax=Acetivibrio clariflavus (strain DSM 19732 / NBRC 101661 / EBR45) TaxID=720554 RepID=G8LXJ6_ACECE|nr:rhomboid family intramembrane serine protease [Acetivibrio clariflavus]AEV67707.1 putative membrane protein [Acetivibrio clariflavus DSM 19732]
MIKRFHYNSPVILTYTILSFIVLLLGEFTNFYSTRLLFSVYRSSLSDVFFYFRLFGHVLGHADWNHYLNNFLIILIIGPMLEEKYGSKNLLVMMAITAVMTGLLNILLFSSALLGASGIVFMFILLGSFANIRKGKIPITLVLVIIVYLGNEVADALLKQDNVSQLTHIAGGIFGCIFGFTRQRGRSV